MNMKVLVIMSVVLAMVAAALGSDHYDSKYDDFDVDAIIDNSRLLKGYVKCFLGTGNCTPDGNNFKRLLPEAAETSCAKCSSKQKILVRKVMVALKEKLPAEWEQLLKKYNPDGVNKENLEKFLSGTD